MQAIGQPENHYPLGGGKRRLRMNRTGGALLVGGVYPVDLLRTQAESTDIGTSTDNLTPVATANMHLPMCVAQEATPDNSRGPVTETQDGPVRTQVLVESTTDIAVGDPLKTVNGQAYLVKATAGTDHYNAIALAARASNDTGLIEVLFWSQRQF